MKRKLLSAFLGIALLGSPALAQTRPTTRAAPFAGPTLPEPPQQKAQWQPPQSKLPQKLIDSIRIIFEQRMADPRGCEYREVEVATGSVWDGGGFPLKTHAWVLPAPAGQSQRFAVCWNGLVYPAFSVGEPADLKADVAAIITSDKKEQDRLKEVEFNLRFRRSWGVTTEAAAVSHQTMTKLKVSLLLRLGETASAETYWSRLMADAEMADAPKDPDPYLMLAREWAWCVFDRAVCAHMRGDDVVSLDSAKLLSAAQPEIEATAAARGFERPSVLDPKDFNRNLPNPPYLGFLEQLSSLRADEERRVKAAQKPLALQEALKITDQAKRIDALIFALEDVAERQWGQPGGVGLDASPIIVALEKEGAAAVEPLLKCFETDNRLTRSVSFGRDFQERRNLIQVASAAYATLVRIFETREFANNRGGGDRKAMARELRGFWEKSKGKTAAERWYATLADDNAHRRQWLEAAQKIMQPVDVEERGGWVNVPDRKPGATVRARGEELRGKRNPSVSELLARRVPQMAASEPRTSHAVFAAGDATAVALLLSKWDPKAAVPVLREQIEDCKRKAEYWKQNVDVSSLSVNIADLSAALAKAGAQGSLKDYAAWLRAQKPEMSRREIEKLFEPMWQNPDDVDIQAAADWLFNDPASPWRSVAAKRGKESFADFGELVSSPLLGVSAFRKSILTNLRDKTQLGALGISEGNLQIEMNSGAQLGSGFIDPEDPLLPKGTEKRPIRVCDWYALYLSRLEGSPLFEIYWPDEKKDAAVEECETFVRKWGERFRYSDAYRSRSGISITARMTFPTRDRPATEAEVQAKTAIFSLGKSTPVRLAEMPRLPIEAKWKTFKKHVVLYQQFDEKTGKDKIIAEPDQDGVIWQAEEVLENGQWKRYYGFVGRHIIAKVAAEEIDLSDVRSR